MLSALPPPSTDPIIEVSIAFGHDSRPHKVDLGIGVYKDESGATPVMRAVRSAEQHLAETSESKKYLSFVGDDRFNAAMLGLLCPDTGLTERAAAIQTPGAGGAIRLLAELIRQCAAEARVWISSPTWVNHEPILSFVGVATAKYAYTKAPGAAVDFDRMHDDLSAARRGDMVLLHACCHNPSGEDLDDDQWQAVADLCERRGLVPFVDVAYLGFGSGLGADVAGLATLARQLPLVLVAASCSKNFGLYRDRAGCAALIAADSGDAQKARSAMAALARVNWSFPPHHAGAVVSHILHSEELKGLWQGELEAMRQRIVASRRALAGSLAARGHATRIEQQQGMFSNIGLTPEAVRRLRAEHAVYVPPDGRLNIAGLTAANTAHVAQALADVLGGVPAAPQRA